MSPSDYSVIVVEDVESELLLLKRAFQAAKIRNPIHYFRDGQEAIDWLNPMTNGGGRDRFNTHPALMLLDLKMPRKTGLEVLEWLRAHPPLNRLATVMMSNSESASDINRAYDLGCNAYLLKPLNYSDLVELVELICRFWLLQNKKSELR